MRRTEFLVSLGALLAAPFLKKNLKRPKCTTGHYCGGMRFAIKSGDIVYHHESFWFGGKGVIFHCPYCGEKLGMIEKEFKKLKEKKVIPPYVTIKKVRN